MSVIKRKERIENFRNIGIMAHIDAGKTTSTERILFHTKRIHRIGETHDGDSQMDWMAQEKERGITITSAATTAFWKDFRINIIDTPGHVDFTIEVERSLRVLDGAIAVLDAQAGVEPQTETVWRQATTYNVPRIVFVNKMDKIGADLLFSLKTIRSRLGAKAALVQLAIGKEDTFDGLIDLIEMRAFKFDHQAEEKYQEIDIPEEYLSQAQELRQELLETIADYDEAFFAKILDGKQPTIEEIKKIIRKAVIGADFHPVFCGSAYKNVGMKHLLDGVVDFLPSPVDVPAIKGHDLDDNPIERHPSDDEPFSALAFKIMADPYVGKLTFFRVYSGVLTAGSYIYNTTKNRKERIGRILQMHANTRKDVEQVVCGEIAAAIGLKYTTTGDTLSDEKGKVILEKMNFPEPVISLAVEPKTKNDQDKLSISLNRLSDEDPTFRTWMDHETGQTIIAGMGELHLEIIVDRLKREFKVDANVGRPQVSYRETLTEVSEVEAKYIRQSGGRGQYGHVWIKFEPNKDKGFEFIDKIVGGRIPKEYIGPIKNGLVEAMQGGILANYPVIDVKATLYDGSFHDVDSSEIAFKIAASMAMKKAAKTSKAVLLEPIMKVDVTTPTEYFGDIMGDLSSRRGHIYGQEESNNAQIVKAHVPLSEMFGYSTKLRSMSQGRAIYTMQFSNYEKVPTNIAQTFIDERNTEKK